MKARATVRASVRIGVLLAVLATAPAARAIPEYPEALEDAASMPCPPPCTVCHADQQGGVGTVTKPFGQAMIDHGLVSADTELLRSAIVSLTDDATDSDGDGTSDVAELERGLDPNVAGEVSVCGPRYGCALAGPHRRTEPGGGLGGLAFAAALALLGTRRRAGGRGRRENGADPLSTTTPG